MCSFQVFEKVALVAAVLCIFIRAYGLELTDNIADEGPAEPVSVKNLGVSYPKIFGSDTCALILHFLVNIDTLLE